MENAIADIEGCDTLGELRRRLDLVSQSYGFSGFGFIDAGRVGRGEVPFYVGVTEDGWEQDYKRSGFVNVDPCLRQARRTNTPFTWSSLPASPQVGRRMSGAAKLMEAAHDHGFKDGLVIPFHFRDVSGIYHSTSAVFYWKRRSDRLNLMLRRKQHELHLILIYWAQRLIEITKKADWQEAFTGSKAPLPVHLSDREKDVLAWAAAGLTVATTAEKLNLGPDTVETHIRNAMRKLGANNKTHATAMALQLGLIDL